jgi:hypothetical protein
MRLPIEFKSPDKPGFRVVTAVAVGLLLSCATVFAQSQNAQPHCKTVSGTMSTNLGVVGPDDTLGITRLITLGTVTGDLKGAVSAVLVDASAASFVVRHHIVTEAGDAIRFKDVTVNAFPAGSGYLGLVSQPLNIDGGTGVYAGATGSLIAFGALSLLSAAPGGLVGAETVFRYRGTVCRSARQAP